MTVDNRGSTIITFAIFYLIGLAVAILADKRGKE